MKKLWIIAVLIFGPGRGAHAATFLKQKCLGITISTGTATEVTGNTTKPETSANVTTITVKNITTSYDIWCNHLVTVSTSTANLASLGDQVVHASAAPWNWISWTIGPQEPWYCKADDAASSGGLTALVCRYINP